jgi:hypothetical protein
VIDDTDLTGRYSFRMTYEGHRKSAGAGPLPASEPDDAPSNLHGITGAARPETGAEKNANRRAGDRSHRKTVSELILPHFREPRSIANSVNRPDISEDSMDTAIRLLGLGVSVCGLARAEEPCATSLHGGISACVAHRYEEARSLLEPALANACRPPADPLRLTALEALATADQALGNKERAAGRHAEVLSLADASTPRGMQVLGLAANNLGSIRAEQDGRRPAPCWNAPWTLPLR